MKNAYLFLGLSVLLLFATLFAFRDCKSKSQPEQVLLEKIDEQRFIYRSFFRDEYELSLWKGKHINFLISEAYDDSSSIKQLILIVDQGYEYYRSITGKEPQIRKNAGSEKLLIAVVDKTCGSGCGRLGQKGIEIEQNKFDRIMQSMRQEGEFDVLLFYELGRNFWFYNEQLFFEEILPKDQLRTAYAIFMRHRVAESLGIKAAPLRGYDYSYYFTHIKKIFKKYKDDNSLDMNRILFHEYEFNDFRFERKLFWASFLEYLYGLPEFGEPFLKKLWREIEKCPPSNSAESLYENFLSASSKAAEQDLSNFFEKELKWIK